MTSLTSPVLRWLVTAPTTPSKLLTPVRLVPRATPSNTRAFQVEDIFPELTRDNILLPRLAYDGYPGWSKTPFGAFSHGLQARAAVRNQET